jgi:hypothetical protein
MFSPPNLRFTLATVNFRKFLTKLNKLLPSKSEKRRDRASGDVVSGLLHYGSVKVENSPTWTATWTEVLDLAKANRRQQLRVIAMKSWWLTRPAGRRWLDDSRGWAQIASHADDGARWCLLGEKKWRTLTLWLYADDKLNLQSGDSDRWVRMIRRIQNTLVFLDRRWSGALAQVHWFGVNRNSIATTPFHNC